MLRTAIIQNVSRANDDEAIVKLLQFAKGPETAAAQTIWFGIENTQGQVSHVIGVDDIHTYAQILKRLSREGYWVEHLDPQIIAELHVVVKAGKSVKVDLDL